MTAFAVSFQCSSRRGAVSGAARALGRRAPRAVAPAAGEQALLARLRGGDEAAFAELVKSCGARMLAVARRMLGDEQAAEDVVQEAFLAAYRALPEFAGEARLSTWLHRITVNAALMRLRAQRRRPEEKLEDLLPRFDDSGHRVADEAPHADLADVVLERAELRDLVRDGIARLPEPYRTVLVLRDVEDLDTDEVARLLGVSRECVKTRLHRARQALKTLLERELPRSAAEAGPPG